MRWTRTRSCSGRIFTDYYLLGLETWVKRIKGLPVHLTAAC
jgi:hypothetical protein